jgi:hypothetical protein
LVPGRTRSAQGGVSRTIVAVGVVAGQRARVVGVHYEQERTRRGKEEGRRKRKKERKREKEKEKEEKEKQQNVSRIVQSH